jgi:hypothetical protein
MFNHLSVPYLFAMSANLRSNLLIEKRPERGVYCPALPLYLDFKIRR